MAARSADNVPVSQKRFYNGLSNFIKEDFPNGFYYAQSIDYRSDAQQLRLLPASLKESGSLVTDLLKWGDTTPQALTSYLYGSDGNIYSRTNAGSWTKLRQVANSHGNGLAYFYGDDYLYYTGDGAVGRYGPIGGTPQFSDNFLQAQGGIPTNTNSLSVVSASSQYATAADSASLSITGDITLEAFFKATTLPTIGNSMTLLGKWDESGTTKSYKLDLYGVSGYFGDGSNGPLTISVDTTDNPIDASISSTGGVGTYTVGAVNVSFAPGQKVLLMQMRGAGTGNYQISTITGYDGVSVTIADQLTYDYSSAASPQAAQIIVLKQYTSVTVNSGVTWTAKAWNGTTGGVLAFYANGTVNIVGSINATGKGYRAGASINGNDNGVLGRQGEGTAGPSGTQATTANGNGGGGGDASNSSSDGGYSGGNGTAGQLSLRGGATSGSTDLTTMTLGGGGGSGGAEGAAGGASGAGGAGGGIVYILGATLTVSGSIIANGVAGSAGQNSAGNTSGGGGGGGGSILLQSQIATLGSSLITAAGGAGGAKGSSAGSGNNGYTGGDGRIHLDYLTNYTGDTTPTLDATQDNTLVTTTTIQARLHISANGSTEDILTTNLSNLTTGSWNRLSVVWTAATATAVFYLNAALIGQAIGLKTAISDNASLLYVAADKIASVQNFFNGLLDDIRIWNSALSAGTIFANNEVQLVGTETNLQAYYKFNGASSDATGNANNLTLLNTPTYSSDVPFPAPTTRLDIDQSATTGVAVYTLPAAISEATSDLLPFTPNNDPQKSMAFEVNAKGTGNWILTIHDQQNNLIATQTITAANVLASGYLEFTFTNPWRIVIGKQYHAHLTVSTGTSSVKVTTISNFSTANYYTYFSFLINDTNFHPITRMLNKIVIGNERYLATWDGAFYEPNLIAFPPLTHVRCFAYWRDYLAIGTWQEKADGTGNIYDWSVGKIYFWDGISQTFNFWLDVPEGQVNAMYGMDTNLYFVAGWNGNLLLYQGGYSYTSGNSISSKIKRIPFLERSAYMEVYPQAMGMWRSLLHMGLAANSDSASLPKGVYSWGTINNMYPESLSFDYPVSTGNLGSTVSIGLVFAAGQTLLIGWQDGTAFGCDQVNFADNPPAAYGTLQTLIDDGEGVWHEEALNKIRIDHLPLEAGESVVAKFKIDREAAWESANSITDAQTESVTSNTVSNGRGNEFQYAFDLYSTNGTSPTVLGISWLYNPLTAEQQF